MANFVPDPFAAAYAVRPEAASLEDAIARAADYLEIIARRSARELSVLARSVLTARQELQSPLHHDVAAGEQIFDRGGHGDIGNDPPVFRISVHGQRVKDEGDSDLKPGFGQRDGGRGARRVAVISRAAFLAEKCRFFMKWNWDVDSPVVEKLKPSIRMQVRPANRGGSGFIVPTLG